ncbi:MAG: tyrosinase family protein [bacterium]
MLCRKNVKDLTTDQKRRFVAAIVALRDARLHPSITHPGLQSRYDDFTRMRALAAMAYQSASSPADRGECPPAVFPWHRELVNRFERELQAIDPTVTVPYWDGGGERIVDPGWPDGTAPARSSPSDLTFWLTHANVDRLWSIWQMRRPDSVTRGAAPRADGRTVYGRRVWYDTDIPDVTLETPSVGFGDVPHALTTFRAARFRIKTYREVRLRVTTRPTAPFGAPMGTEFTAQPNENADHVVSFVWISFSAKEATPISSIVVQPYIVDSNGEYTGVPHSEFPVGPPLTVALTANVVRPIAHSESLVIHRWANG